MNVFISYNWANKSEAEQIEQALSSFAISTIMDIKNLSYKDNLREFMSLMPNQDYAIVLVSDDYLKSPNCLYELMSVKDDSIYKAKVLPMLMDDLSIYSIDKKVEIISYWKDKCVKTEELIKTLRATDSINLIKELKLYEQILSSIDDILNKLTSGLNITFSQAIQNNLKDIISFIGIEESEVTKKILAITQNRLDNCHIKEIKLDKLLTNYPANKNIIFSIAYLNLTEIKNFHKSKEYFQNYIDSYDPDSFEAYNNLGLSQKELGELNLAYMSYQTALRLSPESSVVFANLGDLESKRDNYGEAISFYLKSLDINPLQDAILYNLGSIYSMNDEVELAISYFYKSIEINPLIINSYNNLSMNYLRQEGYEKAIAILEKGLKIDPDNAVLLSNLAGIYVYLIKREVNKHKENTIIAENLFKKAIRIDSKYISPKVGLAKVYTITGRFAFAKELLEDALYIEDNNIEALFCLGIVYSLMGEKEKSQFYFNKANELNPNHYDDVMKHQKPIIHRMP